MYIDDTHVGLDAVRGDQILTYLGIEVHMAAALRMRTTHVDVLSFYIFCCDQFLRRGKHEDCECDQLG